jgi:hypothetical protein
LAALGLLSSIVARVAGASIWCLLAGLLLGSVIPFTLIAILPTNQRLLSPGLDRRSSEAERLLSLWIFVALCAKHAELLRAPAIPLPSHDFEESMTL